MCFDFAKYDKNIFRMHPQKGASQRQPLQKDVYYFTVACSPIILSYDRRLYEPWAPFQVSGASANIASVLDYCKYLECVIRQAPPISPAAHIELRKQCMPISDLYRKFYSAQAPHSICPVGSTRPTRPAAATRAAGCMTSMPRCVYSCLGAGHRGAGECESRRASGRRVAGVGGD